MKNKRSDMPSVRKIFQYWRKRLTKYNRGVETEKTCFACLREGSVQRCHIDAVCKSGSNEASNLHLLCPNCHTESEPYTSKFYWLWFEAKDLVFLPFYRSMEKANIAVKFAELIKKEMPEKYEKALQMNNAADFLALYDNILEMQEIEGKKETQKRLF